ELDAKDSVSRDRANSKDEEEATPAAAADTEATANPTKTGKRGSDDEGGHRDRTASVKAAKEGASSLSRGDLVKAQMAFDRAVRADASNPDAVFGLAEVAFENARYTDALDYGRRAVRLTPKAPRAHIVVGDAYFKLLRYDQALAAYQRALTLSPNDSGTKARIERVTARLGK
ncbi:MAG TPA: tetratricopeptide repeat protein, partial [Polyangia bacterium]